VKTRFPLGRAEGVGKKEKKMPRGKNRRPKIPRTKTTERKTEQRKKFKKMAQKKKGQQSALEGVPGLFFNEGKKRASRTMTGTPEIKGGGEKKGMFLQRENQQWRGT